jgi:hypothetical protein
MSEYEIKLMQDRVDEAIRRAQEKLVEKVKRENGQLVVTRDGEVVVLKASQI